MELPLPLEQAELNALAIATATISEIWFGMTDLPSQLRLWQARNDCL
jgi:hypothetical protein